MASRTTLWRWKVNGRPQRSLKTARWRGRPLRAESARVRDRTLLRAAILIEEAVRSPGTVDHVLIQREEIARAQRSEVQEIFEDLSTWSLPANLVAVATW